MWLVEFGLLKRVTEGISLISLDKLFREQTEEGKFGKRKLLLFAPDKFQVKKSSLLTLAGRKNRPIGAKNIYFS